MDSNIEAAIDEYHGGTLNRRAFLARLVTLTGSMAATHLLLERSGLAQTLSQREAQQMEIAADTVTYSGDTPLSGYLAAPKGEGRFPAVVVIHENRGLNDHTRDVARRFAAAGFVALAPDLLSRKGGTAAMESPDKAREAIGTITAEEATRDLKAGLAFLNAHTKVQAGKLASVGFCWGGARSFLLAVESDLLKAAVVFYGSAPPAERLAEVRCPVLGIYGETDERITSQVPAVAAAMQKAGKSFQEMTYVGAGHAFFNDTGERYNAPAAKDAWERTLTFLRTNLK
ncbi:MAG TPA: dienelactone hydrolase family protein [Abditibacteriaceae bacterium]|jgi:carboxymethylenebutenolidase